MRLEQYGRQADRIIIAQELLTARMAVHSEVGNVLLESRHYLMKPTSIDEARPTFTFVDTCPATVPFAIRAFLEGESYEDTVRLAVSLGGDTDTLACMAGGIAEAFFGIPDEILEKGLSYLDDMLTDEVEELSEYLFEE
jgi:ADP-ribosylglycohydrolase